MSNLRRHLKSCVAKFETLTTPERAISHEPSWVAADPTQDLESDGDEGPPSSESSQSIKSPLAKKRRLTTSLEGVIYLSTAAEPRSYTISAFDLSNQTPFNPLSSLESADISAVPSQYVLDLATPTALPMIGHSGSTSLKGGIESNAIHVRSPTAPDVRHQRRAPPERHPPTNYRWIPRSLRKFINSSSLVPISEDSSKPLPTPAAQLAESVSSSSSSFQLSVDSSRRREEETVENARRAFIRFVPRHFVFWVQIPLPPVSPGWIGTSPPPSIPSFDVIHAEYAKLRQSAVEETNDGIHTVTETSNMNYTATKPMTGSWAGQMEAQVATATPLVTSQKPSSSSSSGVPSSFLHSYSATATMTRLPSLSDNPAPASPQSSSSMMMNRVPSFEERDSYYDPTPSGGTTEQQLAARYPYHPAAWFGRLPGPGLSDAEQSMLKMRLLERGHVQHMFVVPTG